MVKRSKTKKKIIRKRSSIKLDKWAEKYLKRSKPHVVRETKRQSENAEIWQCSRDQAISECEPVIEALKQKLQAARFKNAQIENELLRFKRMIGTAAYNCNEIARLVSNVESSRRDEDDAVVLSSVHLL